MKPLAILVLVLASLSTIHDQEAKLPLFSCATDPKVTDWPRSALQLSFNSIDTANLESAGLSARPESVSVVRDDATCSMVIVAHNLFHKVSALAVRDSAVVLQVGTSYGLMNIGAAYSFISVYDSTLRYRVTYEWLD